MGKADRDLQILDFERVLHLRDSISVLEMEI
jgi:hypothetical protein